MDTVQSFHELFKLYSKDEIDNKVCLVCNISIRDDEALNIFEILTKINKKYKNKGFQIFSFPCFQFSSEGTRNEVATFVKTKGYDIGKIYDPVQVNGNDTPQFYKFLKRQMPTTAAGTLITTNFTFFLIDRKGNVCHRLGPNTTYHVLDELLFQLI